MLWLALRFPSLSLETLTRGSTAQEPLAVVDSSASGAKVTVCNPQAAQHGIRTGMPIAAARALSSNLKVFTQNAALERAALERIAAWALQFTPAVVLAPPDEVLLEIGGSLKFFGGLRRLWADIERQLGEIGYAALIAGAPTPLAAQWFARAGLSPRIHHSDALRLALERLPVNVLRLSTATSNLLNDIGARTLGECIRLPRDGLAQRKGKELTEQLDRALGRMPDPRPIFQPPQDFQAGLELPAPAQSTEMLLFATRRLFAELCGLLAATGQGAQRLEFSLAHEDGAATRFTLDLVAASRDPAHLASVLRERLERVALPGPAVSVELRSRILLPLASTSLSFLPDARGHTENLARFIERLRARLGEEAVHGFDAVADHRPERAWRTCEPGNGDGAWVTWPLSARPLWLLHQPRPLGQIREIPQHEGPLTLVTTAERIESGWWDGNDVEREYFVARNPSQSLLWIYRATGGWYLHGFFS